jgi:hypothetical protein
MNAAQCTHKLLYHSGSEDEGNEGCEESPWLTSVAGLVVMLLIACVIERSLSALSCGLSWWQHENRDVLHPWQYFVDECT